MGFGVIGAEGITMSICNPILLQFQLDVINLAFSCYLQLQFFNLASVMG
jgi:hypothetical protein